MIWLRDFWQDSNKPLFKSSQSTYRFVIRHEDYYQNSLGPYFKLSEMKSVKAILAPKELSYWDVEK